MKKAGKAPKSSSHQGLTLAKVLTLIEKDLKNAFSLISKLPKSSTNVLKIGITGPPGAGKSSIINLLISHFRSQKFKVAVLAVDPSSPFSGGALLGDRIRMNRFANDNGVFIRSVGSRGGLGGLSASAGAMVRAFGAFQFDIVIIETVGVGQTELQVMNLADAIAVILVPESGDVIQTLKAGILEIADLFVINKSDRPGAEILAKELETSVKDESIHPREVLLTSATKQQGIVEVARSLLEIAQRGTRDLDRIQKRAKGELRALVLSSVDQEISKQLRGKSIKDPYETFSKMKIPRIKL